MTVLGISAANERTCSNNCCLSLSSSDATFDIMLIWDENQFKFIPAVAVNSNIKMDAGVLFKEEFAVKHALSYVERRVREEIDAGLSKKLKDLISDHVNPHMQKLKEQLSLLGFHNYDFKWIVEKNALRVIIGRSEDSELALEPPSNFMMCVFLNIAGTRNLKSFLDHRKKRSLIPDIIMPYGIEISCVDQKFCLNKHGGTMCTNFDFNFSLDNVDRVVGCEPDLPL
ncbi:hypothetical protein OESDEN_09531 [Oesophagostomum dentatum]|uniref:Uncharacterized protein n=1 Tax=Oesophagostomum dentatum TaxID=61180 RepID=A0A0B1T4E0_OESDE|nr:hypothetical protein OESDEN_09531 [Oesophagostomum dentatum]